MKRLSNEFFKNYLIIFLLTIITTIIALILLAVASQMISNHLLKNQYPVSSIIKEDYNKIDASDIVKNGGGLQIIDKDYNIIYSKGLNTFEKEKLSIEEFTNFLITSNNQKYHYDIAYQEKGEFWAIVTFPTSLRIEFFFISNPKAMESDLSHVVLVVIVVLLIYILLLAFLTFIYSRLSARSITKPLKKLCEGTKLLREGDYSVRVDLKLKNEFAQLQTTFNDMAARIEKEISLKEKSEQDRKRLILDISHDLKNPLSSILGYSELCLNNKNLSNKEIEEYLSIILNNAKRSSLLMNELFELSKLDSPDFILNFSKTDLCEYLREYCATIIPQLEKVNFDYEFQIPNNPIIVNIDKDKFKRILDNLFDNAVKYNEAQTRVVLSVSINKKSVQIRVEDNGKGIPSSLRKDIFKPFSKGNNSYNSKTIGSGLGLSIAKKITQLHNGDITLVEDNTKGSTFIINISLL